MSKKQWMKHEAQSTEGDNPAEEQSTMNEAQSTMNNEESTMEQQVEQSTEHVEGAETGVEQDAKPEIKVAMGIGQFCRHMMLNSSKSNTDILNLVLKIYPDAKTTMACIAWYKSDLRKKGLLAGDKMQRSTTSIAFSAEQLEEMTK